MSVQVGTLTHNTPFQLLEAMPLMQKPFGSQLYGVYISNPASAV